MFITFEGGEGAGKTTQIVLMEQYLRAKGLAVLVTREPGGSPIAERIRELLLDPSARMEPVTEALLYAAARAEHVRRVIKPALEKGQIVLCDRYFDSSLAYQAYGRGLGEETVRQVNAAAMLGCVPRRTYFFALDVQAAKARTQRRGSLPDRIEQAGEDFHGRVQQAFLHLASKEPKRFRVIDAGAGIQQIAGVLREDVSYLLQLPSETAFG